MFLFVCVHVYDCVIGFVFFFLIWVSRPFKIIHSFWAESIVVWDENRKKHLTTRKQNLACLMWPELSSKPQRWDNERFRALKISGLNLLGTEAALLFELCLCCFNQTSIITALPFNTLHHLGPGIRLRQFSHSKCMSYTMVDFSKISYLHFYFPTVLYLHFFIYKLVNLSSSPIMSDGLIIVASGNSSRTACSPSYCKT